ncbi:methyltransferase domain-containing protein [Roseovarius nitratireducens]|uniref:methyltransferase domain-containing protein n=1 Tax=Roseovarius nitratireducens TaxID=2044597 RepID=UPI001F0C38A0|nr:methyltransferase domain-containing protein [Roseovarius nitratireducens]
MIGIDIEDHVRQEAWRRAEADGVAQGMQIVKVNPGPFPFPQNSLEIVFSKDAIIHVPDKTTLAVEVIRVLRRGDVSRPRTG